MRGAAACKFVLIDPRLRKAYLRVIERSNELDGWPFRADFEGAGALARKTRVEQCRLATSLLSRQHLLQLGEEVPPAHFRALIELLLIRSEA